jgi:hypothetical protein
MTIAYPIEGFKSSTATKPGPIFFPKRAEPIGLDKLVRYQVPPGPDPLTAFEAYDISNWDGYDADPIAPETVSAARAFWLLLTMELQPADIAPGGDGTIGFEWRTGSPGHRTHIEFAVGPGSKLVAQVIHPGGRLETFPPTRVETGARQLIRQLLFSA